MKRQRAAVGKPRVAYRGQNYTVLEARAIYPSGTSKVFEFCHQTPAVVVFAFDGRGRLLLTREYRENVGSYQWRVPAGRTDGQPPRVAAQRELREETGYRAKRLKLLARSARDHSYVPNTSLYVAADLIADPLPKDEGEEIQVVPTSLRRACRMAISGAIVNEFISLGIIRLTHAARQAGGVRKFLRPR